LDGDRIEQRDGQWAGYRRNLRMGFFENNHQHLVRFEWMFVLVTAAIGFTAAICVATVEPNTRPFFVNDATVWYDPTPDTIPTWGVVLFCFLCSVVSLLVEYSCMSRATEDTKISYWVMARVLVMLWAAIVLNEAITEIIKLMVGELRPGFGRTCLGNDQVPPYSYSALTIAANDQCTSGATDHELNSLRKSFPSGHTSNSFTPAVFCTAHILWRSITMRSPKPMLSLPLWMSQLYSVCALLPVFIALLIGVSRIIDFHHHPHDVVGGAALGTGIGAGCFYLVSGNLLKDYRFKLMTSEIEPIGSDASTSYEIPNRDDSFAEDV